MRTLCHFNSPWDENTVELNSPYAFNNNRHCKQKKGKGTFNKTGIKPRTRLSLRGDFLRSSLSKHSQIFVEASPNQQENPLFSTISSFFVGNAQFLHNYHYCCRCDIENFSFSPASSSNKFTTARAIFALALEEVSIQNANSCSVESV